MSRSSRHEADAASDSRSGADGLWTAARNAVRDRSRAQTEPIAALVAVLAVGVGLGLYAGVAADATPEPRRSGAEPAMERLSAVAVTDGTVDPDAIPAPQTIAAGGQRARITVAYDGRVRRYGPAPPSDSRCSSDERSFARCPSLTSTPSDDVDRATRPVAVRVRPGDRRPGRLVVEVWAP